MKKTSMKRSQERELALRGIFAITFHDEEEINTVIDSFLFEEENDPSEDSILGKTDGYAKGLITAVLENLEPVDGLITHYLKDSWTLDRIPNVEKAILRLSIAEMLYVGTDYQIAINEAIELTKKYGEENSSNYVNGILNHLADDYLKNNTEE